MSTKITVIQGHPDSDSQHLCHALADAYADGARAAGHIIKHVNVGALDFPILRSHQAWIEAATAPDIKAAQEAIKWADHLVIIYPLWLGTMPALLKGFFEQALRPGFAVGNEKQGMTWRAGLNGRSARIIVTMGMPSLIYRFWFAAHSLKSLERNILKFVGIKPIRESLFGNVENASENKRHEWLQRMHSLGSKAR